MNHKVRLTNTQLIEYTFDNQLKPNIFYVEGSTSELSFHIKPRLNIIYVQWLEALGGYGSYIELIQTLPTLIKGTCRTFQT